MTGAHVLLVDDDVALLRALPETLRLRMADLTVETADSGSAALDRLAAVDYDAIVCDIKMPGMDGLALLARIRALRPDTPTLLITGHGEHDLAVQALRGGAYDFIQKPVDREYFVASLSRAIQVRQLSRRVKELDRLKMQFFEDVSHELRTPLALVLGPIQRLLAAGELTGAQRHDLEVVGHNARTLLKRVNDLLDVSKLEAGKMGLTCAEVDLARLVRLIASHFEVFAEEQQIAFRVETPPSVPGQADPEKLQRVFLNLLSNAFKFAPRGGQVRCELRRDDGRATVAVQDNGPGVKPELREAVFQRFRQGDGGSPRHFGGTGLGLSIAREFVELHGGTIRVDEAPGGGALFTVELPLVGSPGGDVPAPPAESAAVQDIARQVVDELRGRQGDTGSSDRGEGQIPLPEVGTAPPRAPAPGTRPEGERPLVLVVEDHPEMGRFITETFAGEYRTATARDGREGLEMALALRPDLILSDVMMPRMSGDELVRAVRARAELDGIPVVLLTAKADDALRVTMLRDGAQDYLLKPFSPEELRARAGNLITMKRAREVLQQELASQSHDVEGLAREVTVRKRELLTTLVALRESEERFRFLVESVKDYAMFLLDPDGHVVSWNAGAERLTGYRADEIVGQPVSRLHAPEDVQSGMPRRGLQAAAAAGRLETEGWAVRKDGSRFWADTILTPLSDGRGSLRGVVQVTRDITERRHTQEQIARSLSEKEVLLKELHHRVKNNLQIISSLLNLQTASVKDPDARRLFTESQSRIRSMALIHEILYTSQDLTKVNFGEYVQRLVAHLCRSYAVDREAIELQIHAEEVPVGVDKAIPCGLIINELVANALKHAFPDGQRGEIRIDFHRDGGGKCALIIRDTGVGFPGDLEVRTAKSSGLQLVSTLVDQLGGRVEYRSSGGVEVRMGFPGLDG